jgi:hypothetical protein
METIYFYAPDALRQENIQADHNQWTGFHSNFTPWIAQTYFHLRKAGWPCEISTQIPERGILIADRDTLDNNYPFLDQVMLICVKSDAEYHPSAHLHVIYNSADLKLSLWNPYRLDHWPMPGLIPRDTNRGHLVANISYIGTRSQLAPELKSSQWLETLDSLNLHWQPVLDSAE